MPTPIKRDNEKSTKHQPKSGAPRHNTMRPVRIPAAKKEWCKEARDLYNSLKSSGQSDYYQNSDWQMARIACDLLTHCYKQNFYKCTMMLAEINEMLKQLGATEGARRQSMRVELDVVTPVEESPEQAAQNAYAAELIAANKK